MLAAAVLLTLAVIALAPPRKPPRD